LYLFRIEAVFAKPLEKTKQVTQLNSAKNAPLQTLELGWGPAKRQEIDSHLQN
jgi:hypothetical protein